MIRNFIFCFALLLSASTYAQLPSFTLDITVTPETCFENGVIDVEVDGVAAGATVSYVIYKMPDETTPVANGAGGAAPNYPASFTGLDSGDYKVVAIQTVGAETGEEMQIVTIDDDADPVTSVTNEIDWGILCGNDGYIEVTLLQGTAASYSLSLQQPDGSYQLIAGPQPSNLFTGLTAGVYLIGIIDAQCGNLVNMSHTIPFAPLGPVEFLGSEIQPLFGVDDCDANFVQIKQGIQVPADAFPITVTFTIYPPDGSGPVVQETVHQSPGGTGDVQMLINEQIPYYPGEYYYDIHVTNVCGDSWSFGLEDQPVFFELDVNAVLSPTICYGIDVTLLNFTAPYTIEFTSYPPGFAPPTVHNDDPGHIDYGVQHPGPFYFKDPMTGEGKVTYGIYPLVDGSGDPVLVGDYVIKVTDFCGVEGIIELSIPEDVSPPNVTMSAKAPQPHSDPFLDCIAVGDVFVQHQLNLAQVSIIDGPADFKYFLDNYGLDADDNIVYLGPGLGIHPGLDENNPYYGASGFIQGQMMQFGPNPEPGEPRPIFPGLVGLGIYTFEVEDICGNTYTVDGELVPYLNMDNAFTLDMAPGCDGLGSIRISPLLDDTAGPIVSAIVLNAPADFYEQYGANAADYGNIDARQIDVNGDFILDGNGDFIYDLIMYAHHIPNIDPNLPGYWHLTLGDLPPGDYEINVKVSCVDNPVSFTIEEHIHTTSIDIDEGCGVFDFLFNHIGNHNLNWPATYALEVYDEDTDTWSVVNPNLIPGQTVLNVNVQGEFRIVKSFTAWPQGGVGFDFCSEVIHEFEFTGDPGIKSVTSFSCPNGGSEVIVEATGAEPLTYWILESGTWVSNGGSNIFQGLAPGTYQFMVSDDCGTETPPATRTIGEPIAFEIVENNLCEGEIGTLSVQNYSFFTYEWYSVDESGVETLVGTGSQLVFDTFDATTDEGTYIVKIIYTSDPASCLNQQVEYEVQTTLPNAGEDVSEAFCHTNQDINLFDLFTSVYDEGGVWEDVDATGALTGSVFATQGIALGTYTFRYVVDTDCFGSDDAFITVTLLEEPTQPVVEAFDAICPGEDLELSIDGANAQYTYTWTLPNGNTYVGATVPLTDLTAQDAGVYSVVASLGDCQSDATSVTVVLKPVPEFTIAVQKEICTTLSVNASNFNAADATYVWTFAGNEIGTGASLVTDEEGEYFVTVTLDGCTSTQSVMVEMPEIIVEQGCIDNQFMLFVSNTGDFSNVSYDWSGPGFTGSGDTINISGLDSGEYTVTITDSANCSVFKTVTIDGTQCMIPKGVSPNDDGRNDTFDLSNFNVREVKIFNRYGRTVYEKENGYTNEWYGQTTDGDDLLPTATYYYLVTFIDGSQKSGWVYLNRDE